MVDPPSVNTGSGVALAPPRGCVLPAMTTNEPAGPRLIGVPNTVIWPLAVSVCPAMTYCEAALAVYVLPPNTTVPAVGVGKVRPND